MSITISHDLEAGGTIKILPASSNQEGFWILDQMGSESTINTLSATIHVRRSLTSPALQACLDVLVQRYDLLRTTFHMQEGRLVQVVAASQHIPLSVHNLRNATEEQQESLTRRLIREQAQQPFDLGRGPLLRCTLLQLPNEQSLLLLTLHRLIADDWSVAMLVRDLASLYEANLQEQPSPLPPVASQYADFVQLQAQEQTEEALAEHLAYWKRQVEDAPPVLPLPTDRPRPAVISWNGATVETLLSPTLTQGLQSLSQQQQVDLPVTLLTAFATLLMRYTGQQDLLLGALVPARSSSEKQQFFGPCDNTLVLRPDLAGDPTFLDMLVRARDLLQAGVDHETLPFDTLLKSVRPARSSSYTPLFQVLLHLPWSLPSLPDGWTLQPVEVGCDISQFDLTLHLHESSEGLICRFTYSTDLFDRATIKRMSQHWQTLLEGAVADPSLPLSRLPLLPPAERTQLLEEWTATERVYPLQQSFAELFEEQVRKMSRAVAVACEEEEVSYQDLNRQANQLAHQLREHGVGPDTLVALLAERGIPALTSILGIFKAGGGYLPLDPHHPPTRLRLSIEQSLSPLVLCTAPLEASLVEALAEMPEEQRPRYLLIDELLSEHQHTSQREENPPPSGTPVSLAYMIYTSGSTGRPKGAMLERRGMLNHLFAKIDALQLTAADSVAQTASQCFDISVWQMLAALLVGGRVQICTDEVTQDPERLLQHVEQKRISILETVPSWLRAMLDTTQNVDQPGKQPQLTALRWMVPTGEALPVELSRRWLHRYPHVPLLNAYGPTECSDDVTHYVIAEPPSEGQSSMPIGTAIPNMRLYVLDRHLQPQPVGVSGELYVGGIGVGCGYLGDEARTREAFVPDPFSHEPGARLYKTGDLGRFLPDGNLEFLGRVDFQVKIRGFRIELGEIEAVLNQHSAVREAVVLAREDKPGEKRLVAYAELKAGQVVTADELKKLAKEQLPGYMVPSAVVIMEQFPLTSNGKLDRKALPVPEWSRSEQEEGYVAPTLPAQQQLVTIWEELLGVSPVGIKDDFFDLGGDSLMAARLFDRIAQAFGKKLPLSVLFAGATVENVAQALQQEEQPGTQAHEEAPLVTVQSGGSKRPFFYLHGEWRGGAFYTQEIARALGPEQPFYLLEPYQLTGSDVPPSIETIAASHLKTMRSVQPEGPYLLGGYCNGALVAYEMARQLEAEGQTTDLLLLIDPDAPAQDRLFRKTINNVGNILSLTRKQQVEWFLSIAHVYRYVRFSRYRQRKIAELLGIVDPNEPDHEASGKTFSASLPLKLKALLPDIKNLRQGNPNLYDWPVSGYMPGLYPGKITFFWTQEEPWRPEGWKNVVAAKEGEVEIHTLPGNHITCRTEYLPILIEHVRACMDKAQKTSIN
jgi:amino acid adenylation domain-containing protein